MLANNVTTMSTWETKESNQGDQEPWLFDTVRGFLDGTLAPDLYSRGIH